ncbi:hypothetical protein [Sphingobacterium paucimobilis]|uniref:Uncharacterized protein n=1 Tax=Sphingobacterium paucimobilis HER1398 TaxID=1346330 RepID=U2HS74_9SPHI|nr:hypothetical protein [Sphingobacterium paucimobilis]ERJ58120.1 hypothetical protein M472_05015 [Sphingobacterium paucimobilis HER1398]
MKKKSLTLLQKVLLTLITGMLLIMFGDLLLRYFFDISLAIELLTLPFAAIGFLGLFMLFPQKNLFFGILLALVGGAVLIFYKVTKDGLSGTALISNSKYVIRVTPHNYWIVRHYPFAEKVIARKRTDAFFDPNSKMGFDRGYQIGLLKETSDSLYLEINSNTHRLDTVKKRGLWEKI